MYHYLVLYMLGNLHVFFFSADFFFKINFSKNSFMEFYKSQFRRNNGLNWTEFKAIVLWKKVHVITLFDIHIV